jgi:hypothetical protein
VLPGPSRAAAAVAVRLVRTCKSACERQPAQRLHGRSAAAAAIGSIRFMPPNCLVLWSWPGVSSVSGHQSPTNTNSRRPGRVVLPRGHCRAWHQALLGCMPRHCRAGMQPSWEFYYQPQAVQSIAGCCATLQCWFLTVMVSGHCLG